MLSVTNMDSNYFKWTRLWNGKSDLIWLEVFALSYISLKLFKLYFQCRHEQAQPEPGFRSAPSRRDLEADDQERGRWSSWFRPGWNFSKEWPLANLSRRVTFFSKMAFGECWQVWRICATRLGGCRRVWRVTTSTQNASASTRTSTRDICKIRCRVAIA